MPGDLHIDEVQRVLGFDLPEGDFETLAGAVVAEFEGLPAIGEVVRIPLPADPSDLLDEDAAPRRSLVAEVREIDKHVPASLFVTLAIDEGSDDE
jgi:CBS domain containing-hemolysin-like protein